MRRQGRLADPLLDLRLFANRAFSTALGSLRFGTMLMGAIHRCHAAACSQVFGNSGTGVWIRSESVFGFGRNPQSSSTQCT